MSSCHNDQYLDNFVDAFLLRMKKKRDPHLKRKIWSYRSSILLEFVDNLIALQKFTMEKLRFIVRSLKEGLVINLETKCNSCDLNVQLVFSHDQKDQC